MQRIAGHRGVFGSPPDNQGTDVLLADLLGLLANDDDSAEWRRCVVVIAYRNGGREEGAVGITRFVAVALCWRSDVAGLALRDHRLPFAAEVRIAEGGELENPERGVDAHQCSFG